MSNEQIRLVKNSWRYLQGIDPYLLGDVFYSFLFLEEPSLERLFKSSIIEQQKKLIDMLSYIVMRLDNLDTLTKEIQELAIRHEEYGTKPKHYESVGKALLWTLRKGLGKDWTYDTEEAWKSCYDIISNTMISATKN